MEWNFTDLCCINSRPPCFSVDFFFFFLWFCVSILVPFFFVMVTISRVYGCVPCCVGFFAVLVNLYGQEGIRRRFFCGAVFKLFNEFYVEIKVPSFMYEFVSIRGEGAFSGGFRAVYGFHFSLCNTDARLFGVRECVFCLLMARFCVFLFMARFFVPRFWAFLYFYTAVDAGSSVWVFTGF